MEEEVGRGPPVRAMRSAVGEKPWAGVLGLVHVVGIEGVGDVEVEGRESGDAGCARWPIDGVGEAGEAAGADAGNVAMGEGFEMDAKGERRERRETVETVERAATVERTETDVRVERDAGDGGEDVRVGEY